MDHHNLIEFVYRYWWDNLPDITEGYNGAHLDRHIGYRNDGGPGFDFVKLSMWPKLGADEVPSRIWCSMLHGIVRMGGNSNRLIWELEKEPRLFTGVTLPDTLQEEFCDLEEAYNPEIEARRAAIQVVDWLREALAKETNKED